jgi:predicted DNA-binding transcriptional regulator AlpA
MPASATKPRIQHSPAARQDPMPSSVTLSRLRQVQARVGLSRSAIYSLVNQGRFPRPITLGRSICWVDSEIDQFLHERMHARKQTAA